MILLQLFRYFCDFILDDSVLIPRDLIIILRRFSGSDRYSDFRRYVNATFRVQTVGGNPDDTHCLPIAVSTSSCGRPCTLSRGACGVRRTERRRRHCFPDDGHCVATDPGGRDPGAEHHRRHTDAGLVQGRQERAVHIGVGRQRAADAARHRIRSSARGVRPDQVAAILVSTRCPYGGGWKVRTGRVKRKQERDSIGPDLHFFPCVSHRRWR